MKHLRKHIKSFFYSIANNNNIRIALAFLFALLASSYVMDFPTLGTPLRNASFTTAFSELLAQATGSLIEVAGYKVTIYNSSIMFSPNNGVYFDFGCLGYREIIWFTAFMLMIYGPLKHKLWYIPTGIIILEISNILRSFTIATTNFHYPKSFDIIHTQGSLWYMYGTILLLWILWLHAFKKQ